MTSRRRQMSAFTVHEREGGEGTLKRDGGRLTWRPTPSDGGPARPLLVAVSSRGGRTTIRCEERIGGLAGGLIGGVGLGIGIPGLVVSTILLALLADVGWLMAVAPGLAFMAFLVASMTLTVRPSRVRTSATSSA
jgi:hypothetical protein